MRKTADPHPGTGTFLEISTSCLPAAGPVALRLAPVAWRSPGRVLQRCNLHDPEDRWGLN